MTTMWQSHSFKNLKLLAKLHDCRSHKIVSEKTKEFARSFSFECLQYMLNYHLVNIKDQVFHLPNSCFHEIYIRIFYLTKCSSIFIFCFYWINFKWGKNIVKETSSKHNDFKMRSSSSSISHQERGKIMWLYVVNSCSFSKYDLLPTSDWALFKLLLV